LTFAQVCAYCVITMTQQILKLVKIGNSRGVRLPKELLDAYPTTNAFACSIDADGIKLKPIKRAGPPPHDQWPQLIAEAMSIHGDDADAFREWDATLADGLDEI
jgi:antitoxin component of MazEF toxin-antitoxin module